MRNRSTNPAVVVAISLSDMPRSNELFGDNARSPRAHRLGHNRWQTMVFSPSRLLVNSVIVLCYFDRDEYILLLHELILESWVVGEQPNERARIRNRKGVICHAAASSKKEAVEGRPVFEVNENEKGEYSQQARLDHADIVVRPSQTVAQLPQESCFCVRPHSVDILLAYKRS
jgi:hypothetical protein